MGPELAASGQGAQGRMLLRVVITSLVTLPVTIALSGTLFYLLA
ncbi:hypothetical protein [Paraburkholderia piptadeniae]|nr:hypothetical protein [Paraburkholderia piptadeniae]